MNYCSLPVGWTKLTGGVDKAYRADILDRVDWADADMSGGDGGSMEHGGCVHCSKGTPLHFQSWQQKTILTYPT